MKKQMARMIIALAIIATMAIPCYASTGGETTVPDPNLGVGMPINEGLLTHMIVSGFELTVPVTWDISTKSQNSGTFKILTVSSPTGDREINFIMISLSKWIVTTKDGVYIVAVDQYPELIYGSGTVIISASTKTEVEILRNLHFNFNPLPAPPVGN